MAIQVRGVGTVAADIVAISPGLPAGTQAGDILVMIIETGNQTVTAAGWTQVTNSPQSDATDATRLTVLWKRATGTADATTTNDSGNHQVGRIIGFTGCVENGNPFDITAGGTDSTSDTSVDIPSGTTTIANTMVIAACCHGIDIGVEGTAEFSSWTNVNLTNLTEQIDNATTAGNGGAIGAVTGTWDKVGNYGTISSTQARNGRKGLWSGALKPKTDYPNNYKFISSVSAGITSVSEKIK